jgi:hypothetical protein
VKNCSLRIARCFQSLSLVLLQFAAAALHCLQSVPLAPYTNQAVHTAQTSVESYLQLAPLELALYLGVNAMFNLRTSSTSAASLLSDITSLALLYLAASVVLLAALVTPWQHMR